MQKLLIYLLPRSSHSSPKIWKLFPAQRREFLSYCHYYDVGWHHQFYLSRSPVISPIWRTLKTDSDQGLLWFVPTAHTIRPRRFPGLPSVDLLKPVTARAATASPHACLLSISCLVTSPGSESFQQAYHLSIYFALKSFLKRFQHPREVNRLLQNPGDLARKFAFQGVREEGDD